MKLKNKNGTRYLFFLLIGCVAAAVRAEPADSVYRNGRIYTVDAARPWAEALAVRGDTLVFVGADREADAYVGAATRVVDLDGRMVMPGIHDAHTHLWYAGMQLQQGCRLPPDADPPALVARLQECAQQPRGSDWLVAGLIRTDQFPDGVPHKAYLDAAFADIPVLLHEGTLHHALVNSKALQIAGIDGTTPDPPGGQILKDDHGEPTGMLVETATRLVTRHIPPQPAETSRAAVAWAVRVCNEYGITSVQEASANPETLDALQALDRDNRLSLRVAAHLIWSSPKFGNVEDAELERLIAERARYDSAHVDVDYVKMWIDGAPVAPYYTEAGMDEVSGAVELDKVLIAPARLNAALVRFDGMGIKTKLHVAGAGAAHVAIDAIAAAREANPSSPIRHELGHTNLIIPGDMARMRELAIVAEMSPSVWHLVGPLGDPPRPGWPFKALRDAGVMLTVGTDWVVTPTPNLFPGLQGMLQHGEQSIDLETAVQAVTLNGAIAVGWDDVTGSVTAGKLANFIVLDRNLFEIPVADIAATRVLQTVFEGKVVYDAAW